MNTRTVAIPSERFPYTRFALTILAGTLICVGLARAEDDIACETPMPSHTEMEVQRVGGDEEIKAEPSADGSYWRAGRYSIDSPLPVNYAAPTPPGAIEIKAYVSHRRAEASIDIPASSRRIDRGSGQLFQPLFRHIQRREIAMTAPVETEYRFQQMIDESTGEEATEVSMVMAFLYRSEDLGPTGVDDRDDRVRVVDTPGVTVVAIGHAGGYRADTMDSRFAELREWLSSQNTWELDLDAFFDVRTLGYNGPRTRTPL
ncbi:MAG: heme-binding protein, partial [Planctomycetota bacterium]